LSPVATYRFVTTWCLDAPVDRVFAAIDDAAAWPQWWRGVERAEQLAPGGPDGVGRAWRLRWRGPLPYSLAFDSRVTRREPPHLLEGSADGELIGTGRWRLFAGQGTAVVYEWDVRTARAWMNWLAPVARPLFAANHDAVMRQGARGLASRLGATLLVGG
jgi:Polyketide cyclase / dehydrase and lipid transport